MARDWEAQIRGWATAPGATEQQKMDRAEKEIRAAIAASVKLGSHDLEVFPQGSYRNRTNVPRESDVDICVVCTDTIYSDFVPDDDNIRKAAGLSPASYTYEEFKNDVGSALVARFGASAVTRGDKAFNIRETNYRVDADVVAALQHRRYTGVDAYGRPQYLIGTEFKSDSGKRIINWPQQHYDNGVAKNRATNERFKAMVRVLKNLRNEMDDAKIPQAAPIPSFFSECLVWNVPNNVFGRSAYYDELKEVTRSLFLNTKAVEPCKEWGEVNELKYLFRSSQPWSREQANAFVLTAWHYVGFKD